MTTAVIELQNVSKRFGAQQALSDLTMQVQRGELLALLGPNGAGKTTLISLMLGLRPTDTGTVRLLGGDPRQPATRAGVGAMLQDSDVPGLLTVRETVDLFRAMYPAPLPTAQVLRLAGLEEVAGKRTAQLSGGQRRRLVFALSIVGDPEVLFLDEPTTAMDPGSRVAFWAATQDMQRRGRTILLTTHHLEEAEQVADRVVVMDRGRVIADGSKDELRARAGTARVRFLSSALPETLRELAGPDPLSQDDAGRYTVRTAAPEQLLARLFAAGVPLGELEVTRASLEDAFLSLTGTGLRA
ncbi:ABC transporter ATP-binding protein [Deinococcus sonorensis]|uniref:ABC transporter ATP-binding protein n=2 Tax=Deinococcus sonorensis TaxID=309891 RepID=A0AAU7UAK3_9DEIO